MEGIISEKTMKELLALLNVGLLIKLAIDCFQIIKVDYMLIIGLVILGAATYYFFFNVLKGGLSKTIFLVIIAFVMFFIIYMTKGGIITKTIDTLEMNYDHIDELVMKDKSIQFSYFKIYFIPLITLGTFLMFAFNRKFCGFSTIISVGICIFCWYLIFYEKVIKSIPFLVGIIILTFGIREYIKNMHAYEGRELKRSTSFIQIVRTIAVSALIIPVVVNTLPQEFEAKAPSKVLSFIDNQFGQGGAEKTIDAVYRTSYNISQSGYNDTSVKLGGSIVLTNAESFKVKSDRPYYLRGRIKNEYTGEAWMDNGSAELLINRKSQESSQSKGAYYMMLGTTLAKDQSSEIEIIPDGNLSTSTFFTPNFSYDVKYDGSTSYYTNQGPLFFNEDYIDHNYSVEMIKLGENQKYFDDVENLDDIIDYLAEKTEPYNRRLRDYGKSDEEYFNEMFDQSDDETTRNYSYYLSSNRQYLSVPDTVNQGVYDLTWKVIQDEADRKGKNILHLSPIERAIAIKNYLKGNYKYSTIVDAQSDEDFVSDFLLNSKKGYCTYFASAAAIMCRIAGVPARFVEGFNMNGIDSEDGVYQVRNNNAHAWCEISGSADSDWFVLDAVPEEEEYDPEETTVVNTEEPGYDRSLRPHKEADKITDGIDIAGPDNTNVTDYLKNKYIIAGMASSAILLALILNHIISILYVLKKKSVIPIYNYCIKRLRAGGIRKSSSIGDKEFALSLRNKSVRVMMTKLVDVMYDEYYGDNEKNLIDRRSIIKTVEKYIRSNENVFIYIVKKYFKLF